MTIGEICNRETACAGLETTILSAAKLMRHHHVGTLVVVEGAAGRRIPVGIVTDRDIVVEVNAAELDPQTITVGDIMRPELATIGENATLPEAMDLMRCAGVRRLPVVGRHGELVGIVSSDDVLEVLAEELSDLTRMVAREQAHEAQARQ